MNSSDKISILRDRAGMLSSSRHFFAERHVLEVDVPMLTGSASVDAHIDLITGLSGDEKRYLHSSPEYGMKRLLAEGIGDIYQLSHVFRAGEISHKHNPEFMMAEWYRLNFSFKQIVQETCDYIRLFLGDLPIEVVSYRDTIKRYTGIDYVHATAEEIIECLSTHKIECYSQIIEEGKDAALNLLLGTLVEPHLGKKGLYALTHYPASQAALAKTILLEEERVAERFEIYYQGVELANGYHELADAQEQRARLEEANLQRVSLGKMPLPIDEHFLRSLALGLPDCCGVAVGFDRLMMLRHNANEIHTVIPFHWPLA